MDPKTNIHPYFYTPYQVLIIMYPHKEVMALGYGENSSSIDFLVALPFLLLQPRLGRQMHFVTSVASFLQYSTMTGNLNLRFMFTPDQKRPLYDIILPGKRYTGIQQYERYQQETGARKQLHILPSIVRTYLVKQYPVPGSCYFYHTKYTRPTTSSISGVVSVRMSVVVISLREQERYA